MRAPLVRLGCLVSLVMDLAALAAPIWVCLMVPGMASATMIDFDDFPDRTLVTNQHAEAAFSSSPGFANYVYSLYQHPNVPNSPLNILCTGSASTGSLHCVHDTYIDFTVPVNNLTFWAIEANYGGIAAEFNIFTNGTF